MNYVKHSELEGKHALLSPSQYHWLGYDRDKLLNMLDVYQAKEMGTKLHALASECIKLGRKQAGRDAFSCFVNDMIGFKMETELALYANPICFGTADGLSYKKNVLRIFDYKSGRTPAKFEQLRVYAAIFCIEYKISPHDISKIILRIYQFNGFEEEIIEADHIQEIIDIINSHTEFITTNL